MKLLTPLIAPLLVTSTKLNANFSPFSCSEQKIVGLRDLKINDELLAWSEGEQEADCVKIVDIQEIQTLSKSKSSENHEFDNSEFRIVLDNQAEFDIYDGKMISKAKSCSNMNSCSGMMGNMGGMKMKPSGNSWCSGTGCSTGNSRNIGNFGGMKMGDFGNMGLKKFTMPIGSSGCSSGNCGGGSKPTRNFNTKPAGSWCSGTGCAKSGGNNGGGMQSRLDAMLARLKNKKPSGFTKIGMGSNGCNSGNCGGSKIVAKTHIKTNPDGSWCSGTGCNGKPANVKRVPINGGYNGGNGGSIIGKVPNRINNRPNKNNAINRPNNQKPTMSWCSGTACKGAGANVKRINMGYGQG